MRVSLPLSVVWVTLLSANGLAGQAAGPSDLRLALGPGVPQAPSTTAETATWKNRLLTGLGSAALGAGAAFFVSQVSHSDWEEIPGQNEANRGLWAALGGGVGFAVGFSFPVSGGQTPLGPNVAFSGGRSLITLAEVENISADNAYDVVRQLRPEWLRSRPPSQLGEVEPETISVYLDDFRYGDIDQLYGIHIKTIASIRLVPAATATARWGTGNSMGVIQVVTIG